MASIDVAELEVSFPIYHGNSRSLKRTVFAAASGRMKEDAKSRIVVQALRGISFRLGSGAGHDGMSFRGVLPIGMIFVRCRGGVSHNPAESVTAADVAVGSMVRAVVTGVDGVDLIAEAL